MSRERTKPMDMRVMCRIWQDDDFLALSSDARMALFTSIGLMGRDVSLGGIKYTNADLRMDEFVFTMVARELTRLGVWTYVDDLTVEVWPYKDLIYPVQIRHRQRIPIWVRQRVLARDGNKCLHCGITERLELDHIHPWSLLGSDDEANLQTLCRSCNYRKGARV